jgi:hypothetical protein
VERRKARPGRKDGRRRRLGAQAPARTRALVHYSAHPRESGGGSIVISKKWTSSTIESRLRHIGHGIPANRSFQHTSRNTHPWQHGSVSTSRMMQNSVRGPRMSRCEQACLSSLRNSCLRSAQISSEDRDFANDVDEIVGRELSISAAHPQARRAPLITTCHWLPNVHNGAFVSHHSGWAALPKCARFRL